MGLFGLGSWNAICAWQQYVADGVVVAVLLIFGIISAKKGFVKCFFAFISTILALIVAFVFMNAVIGWTNGLFGLQTWFNDTFIDMLGSIVGFDADISAGGIAAALEGKLPNFLITLVVDSVADQTIPAGTTVAMVAGEALGGVATGLVAWLALFLLTKLVLKIVEKIFSSLVENLPIVGAVNVLLGLCVGVLEGLLIVSGVIAIFSLLPIEGMTTFFNECVLLKWLYNQNPINTILSWVLNV